MNNKKYYDAYIYDIPLIGKFDLVTGTILVGTRKSFLVTCFPVRSGFNAASFNSDTNTATIVYVRNTTKRSMNYDMILLNNNKNALFIAWSDSRLFLKLGPR